MHFTFFINIAIENTITKTLLESDMYAIFLRDYGISIDEDI